MLRTIVVRNQVLSESLKKAVRVNLTRCMTTELIRRKSSNKFINSESKSGLLALQWRPQIRYYSDLPSHNKVNLPALSPTMESGSIVRWEKKEGDKLGEGDLLCEIETDKATMGFETPEEGYLAKILIPEGTKGVPVGKLLCIIVENQGDVAAFKDFKDDSAEAPSPAPAAAAPSAPAAAPPRPAAPAPAPAAAAPEGRVYASPMARRLAELRNIRLGGQGSGLYGSLKSGDLAGAAPLAATGAVASPALAPAPAPAPGATFLDIPLSGMRETIAKRLSAAKQTIPHYQLSATISVNDFIVKAVASACKRVPTANSHWMESFIRQFSNVDVSVAVATPTGLITPIVFNADSRGVIDISKTVKELAQKAKDGKLQPQEYSLYKLNSGECFMHIYVRFCPRMGAYPLNPSIPSRPLCITMFNAIINPPQSLILACGGLQEIVIPDKNEPQGFRVAKFVTFTASADHRVIDGAVGAQWMKALKDNLEDPANMIL
ncbi:Dihydrolipoyllysine-residue acetyltransferase component of pyruvate dehydrogenase complex, mitochondrial [Papilio machaon]|uniref:Dihydrolipoamide acetyltransferase component of pyruvate dehydrogenase complex n=1 Tax=Papilio machaon TaxID=76193 RepID=A0A194RMF9_PAPMA|nr:Dihydrolipoyllysine-residue acetyltransferase component of pyruvate dehydrogenase complex, mitochondrial [Papilio machaon]